MLVSVDCWFSLVVILILIACVVLMIWTLRCYSAVKAWCAHPSWLRHTAINIYYIIIINFIIIISFHSHTRQCLGRWKLSDAELHGIPRPTEAYEYDDYHHYNLDFTEYIFMQSTYLYRLLQKKQQKDYRFSFQITFTPPPIVYLWAHILHSNRHEHHSNMNIIATWTS